MLWPLRFSNPCRNRTLHAFMAYLRLTKQTIWCEIPQDWYNQKRRATNYGIRTVSYIGANVESVNFHWSWYPPYICFGIQTAAKCMEWTRLEWRYMQICITLHWRHNDHGGIWNHQPHGCLLNRLFTRRSKETSKFRVTGLCAGNSPGPVNSPHKGTVTRKWGWGVGWW